jgi:hypothetical protein
MLSAMISTRSSFVTVALMSGQCFTNSESTLRSQSRFLSSGSNVNGGIGMIGFKKALDGSCTGGICNLFKTSVRGRAVNRSLLLEVEDELDDEDAFEEVGSCVLVVVLVGRGDFDLGVDVGGEIGLDEVDGGSS